jgi:MFS family permease
MVGRRRNFRSVFVPEFWAWQLAEVFFGPVADKIGRRPAILISTVLFSVATLATTRATDYERTSLSPANRLWHRRRNSERYFADSRIAEVVLRSHSA